MNAGMRERERDKIKLSVASPTDRVLRMATVWVSSSYYDECEQRLQHVTLEEKTESK